MRRATIASSLILLPFMGTGCPSDDEVDPPSAPVLALGFSPVKMFEFTWEDVEGAEHYELLESATPGAPFLPIAEDILDDEISITMPLHLRHQASYVLRACNAGGCTDSAPVTVVGTLAEAVGYFKASSSDANDIFGFSIALSGDGNTLAVGAPEEDSSATGIDGDQADELAMNSGAVYVFARDTNGRWSQQAYVKPSNTDGGDGFGYRVALSHDGDTLAVGAIEESSSATGINGSQNDDPMTSGSGAVYVFGRSVVNGWSQQAYVKASNTDGSDNFGESVALSGDGNTLAVGASREDSSATGIDGSQNDDAATLGSGAVYVFAHDASGNWSQQAYVKASNTDNGDRFGHSVTLSHDGDTLAVGAVSEDSSALGVGGTQLDESASSAGAVYVYARNASDAWSQQAYLKASNTGENDQFGWSVALNGDGNTLAVGAVTESSSATGIGGDQANDLAIASGAVYVFARSTSAAWSQQAYVKASNTESFAFFGVSVALSRDGGLLAVGALGDRSHAVGIGGSQTGGTLTQAGAAYVFAHGASEGWSQRSFVKASNTDEWDGFGYPVALSGDGHTLAVGAPSEDSGATGIGGNQADDLTSNAGAVYLY